MSGFEILVRPFQQPTAIAKKRLVASNEKIEVGAARITFGRAGTIAQPRRIDEVGDGSTFKVLTCDDKYDEVGQRQFDVRRIVQTLPNGTQNPDNFVDVERPYQVYFEKVSETKPSTSTTAWSTAIETADLSTVGINNKRCQTTYRLNRSL